MDFSFINELINQLDNSKIFSWGFTGTKIIALVFLLLKLLDQFTKDNMDGSVKLGNSLSVLGFGFVIMSSDWVMKAIETAFADVDKTMAITGSDIYATLFTAITTKYEAAITPTKFGMMESLAIIEAHFLNGPYLITLAVASIVGALCKIADLSITAGYLLQRVFILKLLQFLFPLAIAFSTSNQLGKFFYSWIMRYIGVFILGIAYIGIIKFTALVSVSLLNEFDSKQATGMTSLTLYSLGALVTVIVTFTIKVKLFQVVTNYINSMFS